MYGKVSWGAKFMLLSERDEASLYRTYFSAFSSTGKCVSVLRLRLIWPCHMIVPSRFDTFLQFCFS